MLVTANGVVKRLTNDEVMTTANTKPVIGLKPGDTVVAAFEAPDDAEVVIVTSNAQALRIDASSVSVQGRGAGGVAGIKLADGATVVAAGPAGPDAVVLTHTDQQTAKVTDAVEVPLKGRGTGGVRITKFRDERALDFAAALVRTGRVLPAFAGPPPWVLLAADGELLAVYEPFRSGEAKPSVVLSGAFDH